MATNFFKLQDEARRKTFWLLVQFGLAVAALLVLTYALCVFVLHLMDEKDVTKPINWIQPGLMAAVAALIGAVVVGGSMMRIAQLAAGGKAVALMLGGREVETNTRTPAERRILNIVEEMAIASGVAVPSVYLLPQEEGINAFAAGHGQGDAVVAVSKGSLDYLSRDELQGVVAHEFSHILNGDMTLDLRLLALVSGIMGLAEIGRLLMNIAAQSRRSDDKKDNSGAIVLLGLGLFVLGLLGAFLGSLLKAAVSRQREFLADASAVQFTRNPAGIGGALKKIGGLQEGSLVKASRADEVSHMFLASPMAGVSLLTMFATHPPLPQRIRAVDPFWDGTYPEVTPVQVAPGSETGPKPGRVPPLKNLPTFPGMPQVPMPVVLAGMDSGIIQPPNAEAPAEPGVLAQAVREPFSARALVYCLLLDRQPAARQTQLDLLRQAVEPVDFTEVQRLLPILDDVPEGARLPLVNRVQPALRRMSLPQYQRFRSVVDQLIGQDQQVCLFEYALRCLVIHRLDQCFGLRKAVPGRISNPRALLPSVVQLLSHLALQGHRAPEAAQRAFAAGLQTYLDQKADPSLTLQVGSTLRDFHAAVLHCAKGTPEVKRRVLAACGCCALADGKITLAESELLRAVGALLECPLPQQLELAPVEA